MDKGHPTSTSNGQHLPKLTDDLYDKFFNNLAITCNITKSAESIGVSRQHVHHLRRTKPDFAKRWEDAIERATDTLEAEARRRALDGYDRPVFFQGKQVGAETLYSDPLMITLLKAHRRDKFGDKGFDLPPGSEIVISMRTGGDDDSKPIDVTPKVDKPESITD